MLSSPLISNYWHWTIPNFKIEFFQLQTILKNKWSTKFAMLMLNFLFYKMFILQYFLNLIWILFVLQLPKNNNPPFLVHRLTYSRNNTFSFPFVMIICNLITPMHFWRDNLTMSCDHDQMAIMSNWHSYYYSCCILLSYIKNEYLIWWTFFSLKWTNTIHSFYPLWIEKTEAQITCHTSTHPFSEIIVLLAE